LDNTTLQGPFSADARPCTALPYWLLWTPTHVFIGVERRFGKGGRAIGMNSPPRGRRRARRPLLRLAGLGAVFVLALGLGAGIAFVSRGGLNLPGGGAEPPRQAAGDPAQATEPLQADATTTSIEDTRKEGEEEAPTSAHNIGVWYDAEVRRWAIFNQDLAPMARGASFDVHVLSGGSAFVHQATAENTAEDETYLNAPFSNANPDVVPSVTQNWNPGGFGGTYNDHPVGVRYDADVRQWVIFNEDGEQMPEGADFNVTVLPLGEPAFVQRATSGNITENRTYIDDPRVNGDPTAILFAIPRRREG
jgi:hypothetical protein